MGILNQTGKRQLAVLLAICFCWMGLVGCDGRVAPLPDRCADAFYAELVWERDGIPLRATLTVGEEKKDGERDLSLCLLAPVELKGVCAKRVDGEIRLELEDMIFDGLPVLGLLEVAELLLATDGLRHVCDVEQNGETLRLAESRWKEERVERYLTVPDGIPRRVVWGALTVLIVRFEQTVH